ncbi:hypothetical protein PG994_014479 [Apiospora phragmitis]|uniref:Uncharacterized protein n=1 Tax=Apiospora phragmitis TaxID=2905665 RepID=A0ABR1T4G5_9PEZI
MLSDASLVTAYVLALAGAPAAVAEEVQLSSRTGLFGDPVLASDSYRSGGRFKAFFESTHFAQVRRLTQRRSTQGTTTKVPEVLSHVLLLYASYQLLPPGYAFPPSNSPSPRKAWPPIGRP